MKKNRKFLWVSSVDKSSESVLKELDDKLSFFYSQASGRELYQDMLNNLDENINKEDFSYFILDYILKKSPSNILEIGCANGRLYRQLRKLGYKGNYTGIEVADYIISQNKIHNPDATWVRAGAYDIPFNEGEFDLCFAFFVLEHLVYPEKAIKEMMRLLKKDGELVLVFPDFVASGRLESQELGFTPVLNSSQKLKRGKFLDAILSLYDSRIRLKNALRNASKNVGEFPINTNPICINYPHIMSYDIDAVYIASKQEIIEWASKNGFKAFTPYGTENELKDKAFVVLKK